MPLKALILDFDGLILDTETPSFEAWAELYREQGMTLVWEDYIHCVGTHGGAFDAVADLERLTGRPQDRRALIERHRRMADSHIGALSPCKGVVELVREARARGIACAVASSSSRWWVETHLMRLGLRDLFDVLVNREDVERVKPAPDLFLKALALLGASPNEAVVFEDSLNGIQAAHTAGLLCVAVPNPVTRGLPLSDADLLTPSLDVLPLERVLDLAAGSSTA